MSDPLLYEYVDLAHRPATADALRERIERTQRASPRMDCKTGWRGSLEMNWVICLLREQIAAVYLGKVPSRAFTMGHIQSLMNDGYVQTKEQSSDQALFGNSGASSSQRHSANIKQIQVSGYRRADRCWPVRPSPHRSQRLDDMRAILRIGR
jgi:hypothetical protein